MNAAIAFVYAAVGVLHLVPAAGVLGGERLRALYGVTIDDPTLLLAMRHRAALFGIVGVLLLAAAWRPTWRPLAGAVGLASMLTFVALAWPPGAQTAPMARVFWADVIASALLAAAWVAGRRGA
jgi:hypothetical protein